MTDFDDVLDESLRRHEEVLREQRATLEAISDDDLRRHFAAFLQLHDDALQVQKVIRDVLSSSGC